MWLTWSVLNLSMNFHGTVWFYTFLDYDTVPRIEWCDVDMYETLKVNKLCDRWTFCNFIDGQKSRRKNSQFDIQISGMTSYRWRNLKLFIWIWKEKVIQLLAFPKSGKTDYGCFLSKKSYNFFLSLELEVLLVVGNWKVLKIEYFTVVTKHLVTLVLG